MSTRLGMWPTLDAVHTLALFADYHEHQLRVDGWLLFEPPPVFFWFLIDCVVFLLFKFVIQDLEKRLRKNVSAQRETVDGDGGLHGTGWPTISDKNHIQNQQEQSEHKIGSWESFTTESGVRHGSICLLSPILFVMYMDLTIKDLHQNNPDNDFVLAYADDIAQTAPLLKNLYNI